MWKKDVGRLGVHAALRRVASGRARAQIAGTADACDDEVP
jgi:hypothetical protein